jgi:hypothetical protein
MRKCNECGKIMIMFHGHIHPIKGKKHIVCNSCYQEIDDLITQWQTFVFVHPTYIKSLNISSEKIKNNFQNTVTKIMSNYSTPISKNISENENSYNLHPIITKQII